VSLFDKLGIDPEDFTWEELALCAGMDKEFINWFFDDYEQDEISAINADQICRHCPVIRACYDWGAEKKAEGLHGGVYLINGKVDKSRNKHKTHEDWAQLETLLGRKIK